MLLFLTPRPFARQHDRELLELAGVAARNLATPEPEPADRPRGARRAAAGAGMMLE